jgi:hypothetical protein
VAANLSLVAIATVLDSTLLQILPVTLSYWYELVEGGKIAVEARIEDKMVSHIL